MEAVTSKLAVTFMSLNDKFLLVSPERPQEPGERVAERQAGTTAEAATAKQMRAALWW